MQVSVAQNMLHVFAKGILVWQLFVSVEFNGVLKFAGTVKIRGFDIFSRCKLREGGYRVSYVSTFKISDKRRSYVVYTYYFKGYLVSHWEPIGSQDTKFLSFGPIVKLLNLYGTSKTGQVNQSIGILKRKPIRVLQRNDAQFFDIYIGRTRDCVLPNLVQTY